MTLEFFIDEISKLDNERLNELRDYRLVNASEFNCELENFTIDDENRVIIFY